MKNRIEITKQYSPAYRAYFVEVFDMTFQKLIEQKIVESSIVDRVMAELEKAYTEKGYPVFCF